MRNRTVLRSRSCAVAIAVLNVKASPILQANAEKRVMTTSRATPVSAVMAGTRVDFGLDCPFSPAPFSPNAIGVTPTRG